MANRQSPDAPGFKAENEIDLVLGNANPNPSRVGCPSRDVLIALARRERPVDDPAYDHLIKCSPCYREVRALQQATGERRPFAPASRVPWAVAAAAVLALAIVGTTFFLSRSNRVEQIAQTPAPRSESVASTSAQLDLRKFTVSRSERNDSSPEPTTIPRARLSLTMLLPVGFEAGDYDVQVLDANLTSKVSTSGRAEIRDYITTLHANLDMTNLAPGAYQLAVRRHGEDWRLFPVNVK
jgi:hypothetical protein